MVLKDPNKRTVLVRCDCQCSGYEISKSYDDCYGSEYYIAPVIYTYDLIESSSTIEKIMGRIQVALNILRFGFHKTHEIVLTQEAYSDLIDAMWELDNDVESLDEVEE